MTVFGNLDKESWDTYLRSANRRSAWMVSKELFVVSEICKCTINVHNYLDHIPLLKLWTKVTEVMLQRICLKRTSSKRKRSRILFGPKKKERPLGREVKY
jgi:hypothetical protein